MAITADNEGFNNEQDQLLNQLSPGRAVQSGYDGSKQSQGRTQNIRVTDILFAIHNTRDKNNTEVWVRMDCTVELKKTVIHQGQTPVQHWGAGNPLSKNK